VWAATKNQKLEARLTEVEVELKLEKQGNKSRTMQLTKERVAAERRAEKAEAILVLKQEEIVVLRAKIRAIVIANARYKEDEAKRLAAEVTKFTSVCLMEGGMWSQDMRRAVRRLFNIGCSIQGISKAFTTVCEAIQVTVDNVPSVESMRRILYEGKVLAELHVVFELLHATSKL
jgi:hypothetical protein